MAARTITSSSKVFNDRAKGFAEESPERQSFDTRRRADPANTSNRTSIRRHRGWRSSPRPARNSSRPFPLEAPFGDHSLFIGSVPHLYPLARLVENYPRYAAVMLDTNKARIFVFGLATAEREEKIAARRRDAIRRAAGRRRAISAAPTTSTCMHIKEVVDTLDKIVREENINHIVVAGADVAMPILREQLPKHLAEKIVEIGAA